MSKLFLMCGIPGSGKSTWLQKNCGENDIIVSRDAIRFSMLKDDEEYFAKENEVFVEFCKQISENLAAGHNVFADATHLNANSRKKVLDNVTGYDFIGAIVMNTPLNECIRRNDNRTGRAFVPHSVIRRMSCQFDYPDITENFDIVLEVQEEK